MNEFLNRKQFVCGLIEVINTGLTHYLDEDSETLLQAVRILRPNFPHLALFEAQLAMHRGKWDESIRTLYDLDAAVPNWMMCKALLAVCKYGLGDESWTVPANEVLAADASGASAQFVRSMLGDALPESAGATTSGWSPAQGDPRMTQYAGFGMV